MQPANFRNDSRNGDLVLRDDTEISIDQTDSAYDPPFMLTPGRFPASLHDVGASRNSQHMLNLLTPE
jgi:hypothetical protein